MVLCVGGARAAGVAPGASARLGSLAARGGRGADNAKPPLLAKFA